MTKQTLKLVAVSAGLSVPSSTRLLAGRSGSSARAASWLD